MELIWCPPGSFIRGDADKKHSVILTQGFYLGKYEVTQEEYEKIMGNNPSQFKGEKLPVETISWNDAVAFCEALTKKERVPNGWKFSLPSEAQWEYACRAGTTTNYSWGNDITPKLANYKDSALNKTLEVGSYNPSPWGFFDMHGNVWERTADWHGAYPRSSVTDPRGPSNASDRVNRGGSWNHAGPNLGSGSRPIRNPNNRPGVLGFRLCLAPSR